MSVNIDMRRFNCPVSIELRAVTLSVARIVPLAQTAVGMRGEVFGVLGRGTHEHLIDVELEEQMVDLGEFDKTAQGGRGNGSFHLPGETGNATDCGRCLPPLLTEGIRLLGQMADTALRRNGLTLDIADQARDVAGGLCCPVGELADFVGDDSETAAGFTRTRRFDGGVECQEVGLVGNLLDQLDDAADFFGTALQAEHFFQRAARVASELVQFRADGGYRFAAARGNAGGSERVFLLVAQAMSQCGEGLLRLRQRLPIGLEGKE
jgi:hypothetical protein